MLSWLEDPDSGVTVCKIKNRYATDSEVLDGCVHLSLPLCARVCEVVSEYHPSCASSPPICVCVNVRAC